MYKRLNERLLVPLFMVALVLPPVTIGKPLVMILLFLMTLANVSQIVDSKWFGIKFLLLLIFIPSIILSVTSSLEYTIRYLPVFFLLSFFPYNQIKCDLTIVYGTAVCIFIYLLFTQLLISAGVPVFINFRDKYYPYSGEAANVFDYGAMKMTSTYFKFGYYRAGGIFYNPNVLGSNLLLNGLILLGTIHAIQKQYSNYIYILLIITLGVGIYLTGSRTYFYSYIFFTGYRYLLPQLQEAFRKNKSVFSSLLLLVSVTFGVALTVNRLLQGFLDNRGSANVKFQILQDYIRKVSYGECYWTLFFGGHHSTMFDADIGYLLGAYGIIGCLAIITFYLLIALKIHSGWQIVFCFLLISIGNSHLYNLAASLHSLILLIVFVNINLYTKHNLCSAKKKQAKIKIKW